MTWRVANRRKARRLQLAAVDACDLGPVIGDPLPPLRPVYLRSRDAGCWVQRGTHCVLAIVGSVAVSLLLAAHLWGMFNYFPHSPFMVD